MEVTFNMTQGKNIGLLVLLILLFVALLYTCEYSKLLSQIRVDTYAYPTSLHKDLLSNTLENIKTTALETDIDQLILDLPSDRYYNSDNGYKSSIYIEEYLKNLTNNIESKPVRELFRTELFHHEWKQPSVILRVGQFPQSIVLGCHVDSINFKSTHNAPGVDDNLSGVVVVLQTVKHLTKLLESGMNLKNTIEFHFYAAEEVGSAGSTEVFQNYRLEEREIVAMLQQDMTGFIQKSLDQGEDEHFGLIRDYQSPTLSSFIKLIIEEYCHIPVLETECGKVCSDHISALMYGYPSVYVLESKVELSNPYIHSIHDTVEKIDFNHMREHLRMTIAFVVELAITPIKRTEVVEKISFRYIDLIILMTVHHTRRFVYLVIVFAAIMCTLYIISDDMAKSTNNASSTPLGIDPVDEVPLIQRRGVRPGSSKKTKGKKN